jgi:hypothetical protein
MWAKKEFLAPLTFVYVMSLIEQTAEEAEHRLQLIDDDCSLGGGTCLSNSYHRHGSPTATST